MAPIENFKHGHPVYDVRRERVCVRVRMCVRVCVCVCTCVRVYLYMRVRECLNACIYVWQTGQSFFTCHVLACSVRLEGISVALQGDFIMFVDIS